MKSINNLINEKLKLNKDIKVSPDKDEEFYEKTSTDLLSEVQNTIDKKGEYHTYDYSNGTKKFKMGFIYFSKDQEFLGIQAFDDVEDFEDLLGVEEGTYEELGHLRIGEDTEIDDTKIIRIW